MMMSVSVGQVEKPANCSREEFRKELNLRRASLTPQELGFLNNLVDDGTEDDIKKATKRLSDPYLFSMDEDSSDDDADDEREEKSEKDEENKDSPPILESKSSNGDISTASAIGQEGSARRRELLEKRRGSVFHSQIWKAHEGGLAVSKQSSRRSLLVRQGSSFALRQGQEGSDAFSRQSSRRSLMSRGPEVSANFSRQSSRRSLMCRSGSSFSLRSSTHSIRRSQRRQDSLASLRSISARGNLGALSDSDPDLDSDDSDDDDDKEEEEDLDRSAETFGSAPTEAANRMLPPLPTGGRRDMLTKSGSYRRVTVAGGARTVQKRRSSTLSAGSRSRRHTFQSQRSTSSNLVDIPEEKPRVQLKKQMSPPFSYEGEGIEVGVFLEHEECDEEEEEEEVMSELETMDDADEKEAEAERARHHTMVMRRASVNLYNGVGMEISDWDAQEEMEGRRNCLEKYHPSVVNDSVHTSAFFAQAEEPALLQKSATFDETQSEDRDVGFPEVEETLATIQRCYSEDELASTLAVNRERRALRRESGATLSTEASDEEASFDSFEYDAWLDSPEMGRNYVQKLPFRILGTSAEDVDSQPHVLSPPLMESLQSFFPFSKTSDNFWMKYSMVRDGASLHTFLQHARGSKHTILAIETVDGEVFGSFTNEPWRKTWSYFGGGESFLWRLRNSRKNKCHSIIDQANLESEIDVYPYTGENHCIQFCTTRQIAVGGGSPDQASTSMTNIPEGSDGGEVQEHEWGFGISLQSDLLHGSTAPCVTFGSPSLSSVHSDGSLFEIINIELWAMTPAFNAEDAEKLELSKLFLEEHSSTSFNAGQSTDSLNAYYS
ncbi:Oxidation resistance protein 1 [Seminavis robusta]|uniref:Oxidation resistance protein 1 n=1 Tax=Seminavis robusta TaxID=568900 RepID=A0A9N8EAS3_9STRA|nr:Oxidation resistance protein 1 [Seminavis robusta]|eukprot:Sro854_g211220.1 Oxidation resistance protein 1 (834) ;mRNA; r:16860-19593